MNQNSLNGISRRIFDEVRQYTMVSYENLACTINLTVESIEKNRKGVIVECGTWMGGSSFAMLLVQRYVYGRIIKPVWMLDSFKGLPPADLRDGERAIRYQRNIEDPAYFDNCRAPLEVVQAAILKFGFSQDEAILVPGWFNESIPKIKDRLAESYISLLRVDCDWYEPVKYVYEEFLPIVSIGSPIIIDDYYAWDGCVRATHEYLAKNDLPWRIKSMEYFHGAWMSKDCEVPTSVGL